MSLATIEKDGAVNISDILMPESKDSIIMESDLKHRVKKTSIYYGKYLFPLFEAVTNSFQAIEEYKNFFGDYDYVGKITITIEKIKKESLVPKPANVYIEDNGIGFNLRNYNSFKILDTDHKKGGKGIGRVSWLRVFKKAEIESNFREDDSYKKRNFSFSIEGIEGGEKSKQSDKKFNATKISMFDIDRLCESAYSDISVIAKEIVKHSIHYFKQSNCPEIIIVDSDTKKEINVNQVFYSDIIKLKDEKMIQILQGEDNAVINIFELKNIGHIPSIQLCADERAVISKPLARFIPDFKGLKTVTSRNDESKISLMIYVSHPYLDKISNETRTEFVESSNEEESENLFNKQLISVKLIEEKVTEGLREYLEPYIKEVKEKKLNQINSYINHVQPYYKILLNNKVIENKLDKIEPDLTDSELDIELYKLYHEYEFKVREQSKSLFTVNANSKALNNQTYKDRIIKFLSDISQLGASKLTNYALHRKVIIELMSKYLRTDENGNYYNEAIIHDLIYPRWKEKLKYNEHNLWLIDDRLSFYNYIHSESTGVKETIEIEENKTDRFDTIFFNEVSSFAKIDETQKPNAVILVEFKKPGRDDYTDFDNPIEQISKYMEQLTLSNYTVGKKRIIIDQETPLVGLIICDVGKNFERKINHRYTYFRETPDKLGWYWLNKNVHLEIITYPKLLKDVKEKHYAFFKELGIEDASFEI